MSLPRDHPMRPNGPIVECPHCGKNYPAEDGPVCARCGGRVSRYNTNAAPIGLLVDDESPRHEQVADWVDETRRTADNEWPDKKVITFE